MDTIKLYTNIALNRDLYTNYNNKWFPLKSSDEAYYKKYKNVTFIYYPERMLLNLIISPTKLLYGNNHTNFNIKDLSKLFDALNYVVIEVFTCDIPDIRDWDISRLDLVCNYYCNNINDKKIYLDLLNKLTFSRLMNSTPENCTTSIHKHNKSLTINFYDKHAQDASADPCILRLEIQYKNRSLNNLKRNNTLNSKKFGEITNDLVTLNKIYIDRLCKLGLNKKFLTKKEMTILLSKMLKKREITSTTYNNMYLHFIDESKEVHKNTLNNYKKLLAKHNVSHILTKQKISKQIDFTKGKIFSDQKYTLTKYQILILFLLVQFKIYLSFTDYIKFNATTLIFFNVNFLDDS